MKKQIFTIAVAFAFAIQTKAQNNIQPNNIPQANIPPRTDVVQQPNVAAHLFKISSVTLSIDSSVHVTSGAGATKNYFNATISSFGAGTIQYRWITTVAGNGPGNQPIPPYVVQGSLQLNGTGTDIILTERDHVNHNPQKKLIFEIFSPNALQSNQITF